jgi:large subunit ribosomal protein L18
MNKKVNRQKRKMHIRKKVSGTAAKPRVFVFKSNKFFYVGAADDESNKVLLSGMTKKNLENINVMAKDFSKKFKDMKKQEAVFDRSGYRYHGLVQSFVEELRKNGIKI